MTLSRGTLLPFAEKHKIFVETGTNQGNGVNIAIESGFVKIISIEGYRKAFEFSTNRFRENPSVSILYGDSANQLGPAIASLNEPVLFWLDAHFMSGMEVSSPTCTACPVMLELEAIAKHPIKNHTILIDDVRLFREGIPIWGNTRIEEIIYTLRKINPDYLIRYGHGFQKNDILIAEIA